jgi:hypothetical protein
MSSVISLYKTIINYLNDNVISIIFNYRYDEKKIKEIDEEEIVKNKKYVCDDCYGCDVKWESRSIGGRSRPMYCDECIKTYKDDISDYDEIECYCGKWNVGEWIYNPEDLRDWYCKECITNITN